MGRPSQGAFKKMALAVAALASTAQIVTSTDEQSANRTRLMFMVTSNLWNAGRLIARAL